VCCIYLLNKQYIYVIFLVFMNYTGFRSRDVGPNVHTVLYFWYTLTLVKSGGNVASDKMTVVKQSPEDIIRQYTTPSMNTMFFIEARCRQN